MSLTVNAPDSNIVTQYHGYQWISKNSSIIKPEVRQEAYKKYGKGVGARDFYFSIKNVVDVPNQTITILQREAPLAAVKLSTAIATGAAGADITVVLDATMYDAGNYGPLRVGDDVIIPKDYQITGVTSDRAYRVMSISGTGAAAEYTCSPYAKDTTYYSTASRIGTEVPIGTWLMIGANSFAAGTAQPSGQTDSWETMTFKPRILKETVDIEGGQISQSFYPATGYEANKGLLNSATLEAEFRLDAKEARAFSFGEWSDNATALVATAESGYASQPIVSGGGMWPHADVYAQKLAYSGDFVLDNLYDVGILQQSQGVVAGGDNLLIAGPELGRDIETSALDFIKSYSGGSDLLDKVKKELGIDVQAFKLDGRTYVLWRPDELADPSGMGLNINGSYTYSLATSGLVVPNTMVTVGMFNGQKNVTIPNVQIGYVNRNGENRRRVLNYQLGVHGIDGFGNEVASSYDGIHAYMLVHMTGIFALPSQWVKLYK